MKVYQLTSIHRGYQHYSYEARVVNTYESKDDALQVCQEKNLKAVTNVYKVRALHVQPDRSKP